MSPYQPNDADLFLADFGEDITCAAVPSVTRALFDDALRGGELADQSVASQVLVMRVKAGAFGTTRVQDTNVTLHARGNAVYKIDRPVARESSLFDYYTLAKVRST